MTIIALLAALAVGAFGFPWWSSLLVTPVLVTGIYNYDQERTVRVFDRPSMLVVAAAPCLLFWWFGTLFN